MLPDENAPDYGEDSEALHAIEQLVHPHGPALVELYFRVVHPAFPIIQKQIFLERHRGGDRQFSPPLLAGIYILALNWWSHDPKLAGYPKPNTARLEAVASRSLTLAMDRPKLSTVQAGLLLLQRPEADSWSLTTQLVAIGQEMGLHLDCSNWTVPRWEVGLRKRIAWALYMQDKWSSLIHGRPSHIFAANWAVQGIVDEDFLEEGQEGANPLPPASEEDKVENERGETIFSQMIVLTSIMAEVMDTFFTQIAIQEFANAGKNATRLILDRAKPVQIRLKEWFAHLPDNVRMTSTSETRLCSTGHLHLAYFATEITLHRRIVQSLDSEHSDAYLLYICRSAAKTRLISAMDFVNRLKPSHLQAFWYFASKINFTLIGTFGSLLWATAPGQEEADFYKTRLSEYRWTLSVSSKRADFLQYAVQMLDASRAMLKNLAEKPALAQAQVNNAGVPTEPAPSMVQQQPSFQHEDTEMSGTQPLMRYASGSSFSGFQNEEMQQFSFDRDHIPEGTMSE